MVCTRTGDITQDMPKSLNARSGAATKELRISACGTPLPQPPPPPPMSIEKLLLLSYPIFMPKPCTHRMHDPGSIVPHIRSKVITDNQMSRIKYNYYINNVSKDYDDCHRNEIAEDSITPQKWQLG
jgi:hypothetical protein